MNSSLKDLHETALSVKSGGNRIKKTVILWMLIVLIVVTSLLVAWLGGWMKNDVYKKNGFNLPALNGSTNIILVTNPGGKAINEKMSGVTSSNSSTMTYTTAPSSSPTATTENTMIITPSTTGENIETTWTPGPGLETPFGISGEYVLHQVRRGESLSVIADYYQTLRDVIIKMNGILGVRTIWTGDILVIEIGETNPNFVSPMQSVWLENATDVKELAKTYRVNVETLQILNHLGNSEVIPAGRWLILPENAGE